MRLNFLKRLLSFLILIFNFCNLSLGNCTEILYPKNGRTVNKKNIHIIGKSDKRCDINITVNGNLKVIKKSSLIKFKTVDGVYFLFKKDIYLKKGENEIEIKDEDINQNIKVKFIRDIVEPIKNLSTFFFHMNEKRVFCKKCHNFYKNEECSKCHFEKSQAKYIHGPVATWQCYVCHDKNNYFAVKQPLTVICLKCHQEFSDSMYKAKFAHAPAVAGYCMECHSPHVSSHKFILVDENINKLCIKCHEYKKTGYHIIRKKGETHNNISCITCHNAHYGESKYLFIENIKVKRKLCERCH